MTSKGFDPLASLFEAPEPGRAEASASPAAAAPPSAPAIDKVALAKELAAEAAAEAAARKAAQELDKVALAKKLAAEAAAKAAARKANEDKVALAKRLAAEAVAKAAAKKGAAAAKPKSRLDSMAQRARRPTSALEAARAAAAREEQDQAQAQRAEAASRKQRLGVRVQALIPEALPGLGRLRVERALFADQRDVLADLWRGHRARFLAEGELERAVGTAAVLHALESLPQGQLVVAHVVTDASDYLVWMDVNLETGAGGLLAAFADARAYFAAG